MTPKAFDFGDEPGPPPGPVQVPAVPKAFDFDDAPDRAGAAEGAAPLAKASVPKPLFDSEDHPAVRDALALARGDFPLLFAHAEGRLAALFRRILPLRLAPVAAWGEAPLVEQAALLQPITELVLKFAHLAVPDILAAALESTRPAAGMFGKLFRRPAAPAQYKPALASAREQLLQLMADSEVGVRNLEASAHNLALHAAALAVVAKLAGGTADAALLDALTLRRTLLQQAVRQAELSILQMGQVRRQAADLIGQISSFLTVTLPALEMAQAQGGN